MKKPVIALAALGAFASSAFAQSSVTLFGIVDTGARAVKNGDGRTVKSLTNDGLSSSRLGFRGVEDLGEGLKAGFWLEAAIGTDVGTAGSNAGAAPSNGGSVGAKFSNRRSTVSVLGRFGELRLGRDYTPTFGNLALFDVYGFIGIGGVGNLMSSGSFSGTGALGSGAGTLVRADNAVSYSLPSDLSGIYGTVMVAAGEDNATNGNNRYVGGRVGYAAGPFDAAGAYSRTRIPGQDDFRTWNIGTSYDFPVVKLNALYHRADWAPTGQANRSQKLWALSARVPFGQSEVRAIYQRSDIGGGTAAPLRNADDARLYAAGYIYNLSKRTALYLDVSRIQNLGLSQMSIPGGNTTGSNFGTATDRKSTAVAVGARHVF